MIIKPPTPLKRTYEQPTVFLAGSIEMGQAVDWQSDAECFFDGHGFDVFNPRRDDWNPTWKQDMSNPHFRTQVDWELDALEIADTILFYFQPGTLSPNFGALTRIRPTRSYFFPRTSTPSFPIARRSIQSNLTPESSLPGLVTTPLDLLVFWRLPRLSGMPQSPRP